MRESTSKKNSEVRNWTAISVLLEIISKNNPLVGISTSSCNASTRNHWNHRWTTSIPMKRLGESQDSNCESVAPFERDFWNDLPKVQIVLKSSDGVNKYQEFRAIIQIYES
ncbi:hypothetical protein RhiirA5_380371 [Rhizophagus irregularis]|uniref:Uncharacterized protein n=1 Tax=Rhizophagus irregularis TaxID=588596 RepID=A0A2N0P8P6_9GLOM|nr:hypothetical protein RhiirA5_380371 [Rhizophagus irregularis]